MKLFDLLLGNEGATRQTGWVNLRMLLLALLLAPAIAATDATGVASSGPDSLGSPLPSAVEEARDARLAQAFDLLRQSPTGRDLVEKAMRIWGAHSLKELRGHFQWGYASRTDAVLIRHYDTDTGHETRERRVTVYLRSGQSESDLVLDLAHELVHATSQPLWDPYDPELTPVKYIRAAIEGEGGEVEAVLYECKVSFELLTGGAATPMTRNLAAHPEAGTLVSAKPAMKGPAASSAAGPIHLDGVNRCRNYVGEFARERIERDFYRVGRWNSQLRARLGSDSAQLPELSSDRPALYSSTGGAPYPVALLEEYRQITAAACQNSLRRVGALGSRRPAGASGAERRTWLFLSRRCPD